MGLLIVFLATLAAVFFRQSGVHRSRNAEFAGICSGLSKHYELNVTAVRILFCLFAGVGGGVIAYILLWALLPEETDQQDR